MQPGKQMNVCINVKTRLEANYRVLPEEMGIGVGVAVGQVHNITIMGEGEGEGEGVLGGSLPANYSTLMVADTLPNPEPPPALSHARLVQSFQCANPCGCAL